MPQGVNLTVKEQNYDFFVFLEFRGYIGAGYIYNITKMSLAYIGGGKHISFGGGTIFHRMVLVKKRSFKIKNRQRIGL